MSECNKAGELSVEVVRARLRAEGSALAETKGGSALGALNPKPYKVNVYSGSGPRRARRGCPKVGAHILSFNRVALAAFREAQRRGPLDPALADYLGERVEALSAGEPSR